jgi:hypothetical protein
MRNRADSRRPDDRQCTSRQTSLPPAWVRDATPRLGTFTRWNVHFNELYSPFKAHTRCILHGFLTSATTPY